VGVLAGLGCQDDADPVLRAFAAWIGWEHCVYAAAGFEPQGFSERILVSSGRVERAGGRGMFAIDKVEVARSSQYGGAYDRCGACVSARRWHSMSRLLGGFRSNLGHPTDRKRRVTKRWRAQAPKLRCCLLLCCALPLCLRACSVADLFDGNATAGARPHVSKCQHHQTLGLCLGV
jgi:hypothetical protein